MKWWLLALPHYFVVSVLVGGGHWVGSHSSGGGGNGSGLGGGLVSLLVLIAAIALLFTGRYPGSQPTWPTPPDVPAAAAPATPIG